MFTSRPAIAVKFPRVSVMAVSGWMASFTMFTSRRAQSVTDPSTVTMALFTFISRPANATKSPNVEEIASLTTTSRTAFNVRIDAGASPDAFVQVIGASTVISPFPLPEVFSVLIVTSVPAVRAVTMVAASTVAVFALGSGVNSPSAMVPPVVPAVIVTSAGSSSQVPLSPCGVPALTLMPATSSQWPEVSIRPPSPPCAPPRAVIVP